METITKMPETLKQKIARIKIEQKNVMAKLMAEKAAYKAQLDQLKSNKIDKHFIYGNNDVESEIERVHRKIPKWAKSPNQINHKILRNYLELLKQNDFVYIDDLENHSKTIKSFKSNFGQMKIISDHNHAKVFDVLNDKVYLWEPVKSFILKEFKLS